MTVFQPVALRSQGGRSMREGAVRSGGRLPGRVVLVSAGDTKAGCGIAHALALAGAEVVLLHHPGQEDAALEAALRIERLGRRCELFAGDLDDVEFCLEGAFQAAYFGSGLIDVVVNVARHSPGGAALPLRAALRRDLPGLRGVAVAAAPYLTRESRLIHIQSAQAWGGAQAGRWSVAIAAWARRGLRELPYDEQAMVHCLVGAPEDTARRAVALADFPAGAAVAG